MRILVAPLNWGLGHASRCIPLIRQWLSEGHEVVLGGDGDSLLLLRKHFPKLPYVELAPLQLRYSKGKSQVLAMLRALPKLFCFSMRDHWRLRILLRTEHIDRVVSDNRFGLYSRQTECIYMTHQLQIRLPKQFRWLEPLVARIHARVCAKYNKVWVPDLADEAQSLGGWLSHPAKQKRYGEIEYIGPLSRFVPAAESKISETLYPIVAVLSGLEPQRSLLESEIVSRYGGQPQPVLIVQGLISRPATIVKRGNITMIPHMDDGRLAQIIRQAEHVVVRSGYSSIMDLYALGALEKAELIPTPGQTEQEYLADRALQRNLQ